MTSGILELLPQIGFKYAVEKNAAERIYELAYKELDKLIKMKSKYGSKSRLDSKDFKILLKQLEKDLTTARDVLMRKQNPQSKKILEFYIRPKQNNTN